MDYARDHGIDDGDGFDRFWAIIHAADSEYLSQVNSSSKKDDKTIPADDIDGVRGMFSKRIEQQKIKQAKD